MGTGVDIESATKAGIKVARLPGNTSGNALSCAEHAIYLILSLLRNQVSTEPSWKNGRVDPVLHFSIFLNVKEFLHLCVMAERRY
jgi:lactate dehydrogenase-like 2-hydroxyacid dehydrogenase